MRYSEVLGAAFYNIGLTESDAEMVDVHFTASAHHFWLLRDCLTPSERVFHVTRHRAHLRALLSIVFGRGDFRSARDESMRGLHLRESWNPDRNGFSLPDPKMFDSMNADPSVSIGEPHPSDWYIQDDFTTVASLWRLAS